MSYKYAVFVGFAAIDENDMTKGNLYEDPPLALSKIDFSLEP